MIIFSHLALYPYTYDIHNTPLSSLLQFILCKYTKPEMSGITRNEWDNQK